MHRLWRWLEMVVMLSCLGPACAAVQHGSVGPNWPFGSTWGPVVVADCGVRVPPGDGAFACVRRAISAGSDWQMVDVAPDGRDAAALQVLGGVEPQKLDSLLALADGRLVLRLAPCQPAGCARLAARVVAALDQVREPDRVALASPDMALLRAVYERDPLVPLVGLLESGRSVDEVLLEPVAVLAAEESRLEEAFLQQARAVGVAVWVWPVRDGAQAQAWAARGLRGLITETPAVIAQALREPLF